MTVQEIIAEFNRMADADVWPGFDPRATPVALFDGQLTILIGYPGLPPGFTHMGTSGALVYPGWHPAVIANTVSDLEGVAVATVLLDQQGAATIAVTAALIVHETFHAFQDIHHPAWLANEADLLIYPPVNPEMLALAMLEIQALDRALIGGVDRAAWVRTALALRHERFAGLPPAP